MGQYATELNAFRRNRALAGSRKALGEIPAGKAARLPSFIEPQLATLVDAVPPGDEWVHEVKLDGYRILCRIDHGRVTLLTRRAQDWTDRFKSVALAAQRLPVEDGFLDGEIVALDEDGRSSFQRLQNFMKGSGSAPLVYFVFDLLHVNGRDLRGAALEQRKAFLKKVIEHSAANAPNEKGSIRYSVDSTEGAALYQECCRRRLEGIICKRRDQPYRSDRSRDWLKVKCVQRQEFVIGGFTKPGGSRTGLGALLLGVYDSSERLRYTGRVGTGFTDRSLKELCARLNPLSRETSPFFSPPKGWEAKGVCWVEPKLVAEVAFSEWTDDNLLRHPSFQGLREDKAPREIFREQRSALPMGETNGSSESAMAKKHGASIKNASIKNRNQSVSSEGTLFAGIEITHPDKILYPEQGITKRALAEYYDQVAESMLPHVERRPLTLVRCPQGQGKECFYQRHVTKSRDEAIRRVSVKEGRTLAEYVWIDSPAGLIALVQMGVLEIHTWGSRIERIDQSDRLIFDLDPDPSVSWARLRDAAQTVGDFLRSLGLAPFVKSTGGKGLHVVVPLAPDHDWNFVKEFSKKLAQSIVRSAPDRFTAGMSKAKRKGKIFIDYLRNAKAASAVCAYSTRALAGAPVSVPLRWEELSRDVRSEFTVGNVPERLAHLNKDPWEGYEAARAVLTKSMAAQL